MFPLQSAYSKLILTLAAICMFTSAHSLASAQTETVLHEFGATDPADGFYSLAGLTVGPSGQLYGETWLGGAFGYGTVFELLPPDANRTHWQYTIIHNFSGPDGANPAGNVRLDRDGYLYGTTEYGGEHNRGSVFRLTPPASPNGAWNETVLYSFQDVPDGALPFAGVTFDNHGNLFGTTWAGGQYGSGTIFQLTPPTTSGDLWSEQTLWSFQLSGGGDPIGGLAFVKDGTFYGFTNYGLTNAGTIYQLSLDAGIWKLRTLYAFTGPAYSGSLIGTPILDKHGAIYGTTSYASTSGPYGVAFRLAPPAGISGNWKYHLIRVFPMSAEGVSGLIFDDSGRLYGETHAGGTSGDGVLFQLTPAYGGRQWKERVLYNP